MASSMNDNKAPKTMDVMQPGKAAPSPTARPVIVSNRPILRQDPMMVSPNGMEKTVEPTGRPNVSRVGKTLTVLAPHQSKTAKAPTMIPLSDSDKAKEGATEPAAASENPAANPMPQGRTPEEIATKKAIAVKTDDTSSESSAAVSPTPAKPEEAAAPMSEPAPQEPKPADPSAPLPEAPTNKPAPSPAPMPQPTVTGTPSSAPSTALSTEDDISAEPEAVAADDEAVNSSDGQLAPNKTLDEAKKKADDIEAARLAEQDQIIGSRRYYLPIANTAKRRGLTRSLMVLLLVLVLAAVWFDVVLDAGIVHVGGLRSLTHFFR